ncbi:Tc5 transposase DNA-binding domain-containing protein [Hirsutella rhossiliensis]|uniref:Tc5 transposase DNA-binding domain-containing protein n=1 Tax=Hirsutella rhossiliensis TaxID=111463 RepID=A0A9P8MXB3_9HYPO|nr:tc5 transposase DNA-binding domain-containing protein [Hirsutella rhossiliensis]KAH0960882.1 tc5 transposase DNA-binding domain-containing protein [Hirsutella rhossiliensis]
MGTPLALEAIANGGSAKKAARDWGVLRATLYNRMHGHECRKDAFSALQRLSQTQEKQLTEWILIQDALGLPPTHSQIRQFAQRMLAVKGDHTPLGKHWMQAFLRRNPAVRPRSAITETLRVSTALLPRYNMDEAGIMEGLGENGLVVGSAEKRSVQKKTPGSRVWTSFIECVSAAGTFLLHSSFSRANRSRNSGSQKISVLLVTGNSLRQRTAGLRTKLRWSGSKGVHSKNPATRPFGAKTASIGRPRKSRDG